VRAATTEGFSEDWNLADLWTALKLVYPISFTLDELLNEIGGLGALDAEFLEARILEDAANAYEQRENELGSEVLRELERKVLLSVLDRRWREHLYEMDYLQEGIGLRAMAQRDPLVEYQREGYELFAAMMEAVKEELASLVFNVEVTIESSDGKIAAKGLSTQADQDKPLTYTAPGEDGTVTSGEVSRNSQCPCGSGKKFKRCHGAA
jgi:preprotein translocase subunit SecA